MAQTQHDTLRFCTFLDKGGTGKTTSAAHLGVALAEHGLDVLLIDLAGKQGDLAKHFGVWEEVQADIASEDDWPNISTVFQDQWGQVAQGIDGAVDGLIHETGEGPDIIPAHPGLDGLDDTLGTIDDAEDRYSRLDAFLTEYVDPLGYDAVGVDLPGLTNNVTVNGLWAAQNVVAPVEMGPFESEQAESLTDDLDELEEAFGIEVALAMVLPNKVDMRTTLGPEFLELFEDTYPEEIAPKHIPSCQDIRNAANQGQTLFEFDGSGGTTDRAREAYLADAAELASRLGVTV